MHNRVISAVGNQSASGDPQQHKHDMNDKLIRAAGGFAAGKTLGMSEEETLAMMSRQLRRQQRADSNVTMSDVARQFAQAGNSLSDVSESAEIKGVGYADDAFLAIHSANHRMNSKNLADLVQMQGKQGKKRLD